MYLPNELNGVFEGKMVAMFILYAVLFFAAITDLRFQKIPNWLTLSAILSGISINAVTNGFNGFLLSTTGVLLGVALLILFYFLGGMGGGDVKLMGAVGAFLGPKGVVIAFVATALVGGAYAFILLASHGQLSKSLKRYSLILKIYFLTRKVLYVSPSEAEKKPRLRYGIAIALGTIISVVMKESLYRIMHLN
jgi:prepilin peptidase CpaA